MLSRYSRVEFSSLNLVGRECIDAVCAFHGASPRDRWLCVSPRGQLNVNVNVNGLRVWTFY